MIFITSCLYSPYSLIFSTLDIFRTCLRLDLNPGACDWFVSRCFNHYSAGAPVENERCLCTSWTQTWNVVTERIFLLQTIFKHGMCRSFTYHRDFFITHGDYFSGRHSLLNARNTCSMSGKHIFFARPKIHNCRRRDVVSHMIKITSITDFLTYVYELIV